MRKVQVRGRGRNRRAEGGGKGPGGAFQELAAVRWGEVSRTRGGSLAGACRLCGPRAVSGPLLEYSGASGGFTWGLSDPVRRTHQDRELLRRHLQKPGET